MQIIASKKLLAHECLPRIFSLTYPKYIKYFNDFLKKTSNTQQTNIQQIFSRDFNAQQCSKRLRKIFIVIKSFWFMRLLFARPRLKSH